MSRSEPSRSPSPERKEDPKNANCATCVKRKRPTKKSAWSKYLANYKLTHPEMDAGEAQIQARKRYVPGSGKEKSYERLFREVFDARFPSLKETLPKDEYRKKMRLAFIDVI